MSDTYGTLTPSHLERLRAIVGDDGLRTDDAARDTYGRDETEDLVFPPAAIALPASTDEVSRVLALASEGRIPVTPRGAGTGLSGGALPVHGGLVLSVERMDRIRAIDTADMVVETETGIVTGELQRRVAEHGLFYPPDPSSRDTCLLAGNLAEDAAGPRCCKYGSTGKWVLGLEAVLADGSVLQLGGRNRKDVAGYDLVHLLVGSEGTLAVLTAATLRLVSQPRARLTVLLPFPDLEPAAEAVSELFRRGHHPAACELVEEGALGALARVMDLPPQLAGQKAVILLELDGDDEEALLETAMAIAEIAAELGGGEPIAAQDAAEERRLWAIRRKVADAVKALSVYKEADTVVPRSQLAALVRAARDVAGRHGLQAIAVGHAGDGNLHVLILRGDLDAEAWEARRDAVESELFARVVALGGSIAGEHGIGWTQRRYLGLKVGDPTIELMRRIKAAWDPLGILNPGKILP